MSSAPAAKKVALITGASGGIGAGLAAAFGDHGYAVVAIGLKGEVRDSLHWRRLAALLRHRGVEPQPPRHFIRTDREAAAETQRLAEFLSAYDLPLAEQRRWRV